MRILHVTDFHLYHRWFVWLNREASKYEAVAFTGDALSHLGHKGSPERARQEGFIRFWLENAHYPLYYSRGGYDPTWLHQVKNPNLHLGGTYSREGWRIVVVDAHAPEVENIEPAHEPTVLVSHYPPAKTSCSTERTGRADRGRGDVRRWVEDPDVCRLCLCGHVHDPVATFDTVGSALVINPGLSYYEHRDWPAYSYTDTDARVAAVDDGRNITTLSFAR